MPDPSPTITPAASDLETRLEPHRSELTAYCYRMLGSPFEAEDAVQETFIRAWKSYDRFEGRAVAALVALPHRDERLPRHAERARAPRAADGSRPGARAGDREPEHAARGDLDPADPRRPRVAGGDPAEVAVARETIQLAFVAALQHLPPRQRAVLILCEVLRWQASRGRRAARDERRLGEQRAAARARDARGERTSERRRADAARATSDRALLARYVEAFERYDIDALTALIQEDATQSMPPFDLWLQRPRRHPHLVVRAGDRLRGLARDPDASRRTARLRSASTSRARAARASSRGRCRCSSCQGAGSSSSRSSSTPTRSSRSSGCPPDLDA